VRDRQTQTHRDRECVIGLRTSCDLLPKVEGCCITGTWLEKLSQRSHAHASSGCRSTFHLDLQLCFRAAAGCRCQKLCGCSSAQIIIIIIIIARLFSFGFLSDIVVVFFLRSIVVLPKSRSAIFCFFSLFLFVCGVFFFCSFDW